MAPPPRQHKLIIEAIVSLGEKPFSGWQLARMTGVPRASVSRALGVLKEMGLLTYTRSGGHTPWDTSMSWQADLEWLVRVYEDWLSARSVAKRREKKAPRGLDTGAGLRYTQGYRSDGQEVGDAPGRAGEQSGATPLRGTTPGRDAL